MKFKALNLIILTTLISCNIKNSTENNSNENSKNKLEQLKNKEADSQIKPKNNSATLISTIEFELKAEEDELQNFTDGIIPWISIENPESEIKNLIDADKIVIEKSEIILNIDYPLNKPAKFTLKSDGNGFTKKQLITEISIKYKEIYDEEEKTSSVKTIPIDKRKGIINRNETDGKYGIWGHDIGDLDLSSIEVYKTKEGKIEIILGIES